MPTIRIIISGEVQGVFFRAKAKEVAKNLKITGWIKNTEGGNVEGLVSGTQQQLDELIEWCRKGPPKAKVDNIDTMPSKDQQFNDFTIIR